MFLARPVAAIEEMISTNGEAPGTPDTEVSDDLHVPPQLHARIEGDFAHLLPDDAATKQAFNSIAAVALGHPGEAFDWKTSMHINPERETISVHEYDADSDNELAVR